MSQSTTIGWTEATWNYIRAMDKITRRMGWFCTKRTSGCVHCYSEAMNLSDRGNGLSYTKANLERVEFLVSINQLEEPLSWRDGRVIFVNSMTDFFHPAIPDWMRRVGFAVMACRPDHTFQILTKQPEVMEAFMRCVTVEACFDEVATRRDNFPKVWASINSHTGDMFFQHPTFPLPNVRLGVSVAENKDLWMLDVLRRTPCARRFVSFEPLLEVIDLGINGAMGGIDAGIVGGESGRERRDCGVDAIVRTADALVAEGKEVFVKQDCAEFPGARGRIPTETWNLKQLP